METGLWLQIVRAADAVFGEAQARVNLLLLHTAGELLCSSGLWRPLPKLRLLMSRNDMASKLSRHLK